MIEFIFTIIIILFWLLFFGIGILATVFWIFMIIDCAKREFPKSDDKIMWILLIVLVGAIGAIIYYFVVKSKDKKPESNEKLSPKAKK